MFESIVRSLLYYPSRLSRDAPPPPYAAGAREVWIQSDVGDDIHGLYWPANEGRPTLLFFHGNAQSVFEWALIRQDFELLECGLLLIDYPGYGKSSGSPREEGLYAAGLASFNWLTDKEKVEPSHILLFGKSLGGPVATQVATTYRCMGVVLESTFRSLPRIARRMMPMIPADTILKSERYESEVRIASIQTPLLVVHGTRDELIPVKEGQALFEAALEPKKLYLVEGAGHNDVAFIAGSAYGQTLRGWLDSIAPDAR